MAMKIEKSTFGATKHGEPVSCYTIYTPDLRVKLLDYGATVQSLFVKDNDGKWVDVVLGYDTIREYEDNDGYFGACIGRIGNRIGGARFTLNGNTYSLYKNDGENHLHGGQHGFNSYIWQAEEVENGLRFSRVSPDGEEGYPGTLHVSVTYLIHGSIGTIFVQLTLGMNAFITAQGFAKTGMLTVLIGAVCNIVLDPLFIFAFHMGVRGAALATILSQGVSCVWVCAFLRGKKTLLRLKNENIRLRPKFFLPCIALGAASFIMQASESVISVCFNTSLLKYGGDIAVGAMTILTSVMQFAMLPLQGLAQGAQPILSYNYGAKSAGRVRKAFQLLLISSLVYSTLLWGAIQIFPSVFASIFTPNEALIVFAAKALRIYCGVLVLFGIQIACQMTFVSLGNAPCSIIVAVVRKFVLLIPLIYIMPQLVSDQAMGVYMAEPVADVIAVMFTAILFSRQFRKSMTALELEAKNSDA